MRRRGEAHVAASSGFCCYRRVRNQRHPVMMVVTVTTMAVVSCVRMCVCDEGKGTVIRSKHGFEGRLMSLFLLRRDLSVFSRVAGNRARSGGVSPLVFLSICLPAPFPALGLVKWRPGVRPGHFTPALNCARGFSFSCASPPSKPQTSKPPGTIEILVASKCFAVQICYTIPRVAALRSRGHVLVIPVRHRTPVRPFLHRQDGDIRPDVGARPRPRPGRALERSKHTRQPGSCIGMASNLGTASPQTWLSARSSGPTRLIR